jgi:hypothetical protein
VKADIQRHASTPIYPWYPLYRKLGGLSGPDRMCVKKRKSLASTRVQTSNSPDDDDNDDYDDDDDDNDDDDNNNIY